MSRDQRGGVIWIARNRWGWVAFTLMAWICAGSLLLWTPPVIALQDVSRPRPAIVGYGIAVYLVLVAVALAWSLQRAWYWGMRFDDNGVSVCNWFRTWRAAWGEVSSFTDGTTDGRDWALTVMLRDGRGVTASATQARPGSPEILTAVRQVAGRHEVPATLTGVAAERPRAWLDAASEARLQGARFAVWLAVAVIAAAGVVPLTWWGLGHRGNYYLATCAGLVAVTGLPVALVARRKRDQFLGRRPFPVEDSYGEGGWFAVPLPKGGGFAPGLIVRAEARRDGIVLCCFFAPLGTEVPTPGQLRELCPADAVLVRKLAGLDKEWPRLGQAPGWERSAWPAPVFRHTVKKTGEFFKVSYGDDLAFIGQQAAGREELDSLPSNDLLSPARVVPVLAGLVRLSRQQAASAARPQPSGQVLEARTVIADTVPDATGISTEP